jgi:HEAT repeat protein
MHKNKNDTFTSARADDEIDFLISEMESENGMVRKMARERLVAMGPKATPRLIGALSDPHAYIRWEAAKALKDLKDPSARWALIQTLEDEVSDIRWLAAEGLAALREDGLKALLQSAVRKIDSDYLREGVHHVCNMLAKEGLSDLVAPMIDAMEKPDPKDSMHVAAFIILEQLE